MSADMRQFWLAVGLFLLALLGLILYYYRRSRKIADATWEQLLRRLIFIDRNGVEQIARDAIDEGGNRRTDDHALELEAAQIWNLIGGMDGLKAVEHNSQVLVDMAAYLQQWYPEALVTAEELRLTAREIEWHVGRLKAGAQSGNLEHWFANYAQNAVASYYVMTRRLLDLYEKGNCPMRGDLQKVLQT